MIFYSYVFIFVLFCILSANKVHNEKQIYSLEQNLPLRGILVVLVIMNHIFKEAYMFGNVAVTLYFLFSGYGLAKGYKEKEHFFNKYISKKVKKIVIPYIIINILYIIWNLFFKNEKYTIIQILVSFFTASIMPVGWYIITITLLYMIFYLIYKLLKINDIQKMNLMIMSEIILIIVLYLIGCGSWWYCSIFGFVFGIIMIEKHSFFNKISNNFLNLGYRISIILFIATYVVARFLGIEDGIVFLIIKFMQSILICNIYYNFSKKYVFKNKFLNLLGKNSLIIFMIHPLILRIIGHFSLFANCNFIIMLFVLVVSLICSLLWNNLSNLISRGEKNDKIKSRL